MSRMLTVRDLMTEDVETVPPHESLANVQALMLERNFRHVPVVDDDTLIGLISQRDITSFLGRKSRGDITEQQLRLVDVPASRAMSTGLDTIDPETTCARPPRSCSRTSTAACRSSRASGSSASSPRRTSCGSSRRG